MIDEGEADWKVVAIDREDPWAQRLHDIEDVEREVPGILGAMREWFRTYKVGMSNALQRTAAHCNALQRTATHCNALERGRACIAPGRACVCLHLTR